MVVQYLRRFLKHRLFLYANRQLFRLQGEQLIKVEVEAMEKAFFPIVVIGKEHYSEADKRYPVSNSKDLADILKYENHRASLQGPPSIYDDYSVISQVELDSHARTFLGTLKLGLWLPESWLLFLPEGELINYSRGNSQFFGINMAGRLMLSAAQGPFKSRSYFLLSVGASEHIAERSLDGNDYVQLLISGFEQIDYARWIALLKAQGYAAKLNRSSDWLSLIGGGLLGIVLFNLVYWTYLTFKNNELDNQISRQNVAEVIKLQQKFNDSQDALKAIQNGGFDKSKVFSLWDLLITLMENRISILRVTSLGNAFELYIESTEATETVEFLSAYPSINTVELSTPVRSSLNNERFGLKITFKTKQEEEK